MSKWRVCIIGGGLLLTAGVAAAAAPATGSEPGAFGTVDFPVSCGEAEQRDFNLAVAVLHSFWFDEAQRRFEAIAERAPDCAMAQWGIAMSLWQPLWRPPAGPALEQGHAAVQRARRRVPATAQRERAWIEAIGAFYDRKDRPHGERVKAYARAMRRLYAAWPDDVEAGAFYGLALQAAAPRDDRSYAQQRRAAEMLGELFERHPDHPGIAHYLIHALDYPALAEQALPAAQRYARIAPAVSHAQHMPSHIFSQLGLWEESLASNRASAAAARQHDSLFDLAHALEWQAYAALQTCRDGVAHQTLEELASYQGHSDNFAVEYSIQSIAARYWLERQQWAQAAAMEVPQVSFAYAESTGWFARALGASRIGDVDTAAAAVRRLKQLAASTDKAAARWRPDIRVQHLAASAWLLHARGDSTRAMARIAEAGALEERTYTPGPGPAPVIPARELEGDLLLELGEPAAALVAYQAALEQFAGRLNAFAGAARAARASGDVAQAEAYAAAARELCGRGSKPRPALAKLMQGSPVARPAASSSAGAAPEPPAGATPRTQTQAGASGDVTEESTTID